MLLQGFAFNKRNRNQWIVSARNEYEVAKKNRGVNALLDGAG
jgi:hypothetical protein